MIPAQVTSCIPTMTREAIDRVYKLEQKVLEQPQADISTHHMIHGGMYARTICIPKGVVLTGAEIKLATVLIVSGHVRMAVGDDAREFAGYNVLAASKGRKQAFYALEDTYLTMLFPTRAQSVEDAEAEFTDDHARLFSRHGENEIVITGE